MPDRDQITDMMIQMLGRQPTEAEVDKVMEAYDAQIEQLGELERLLPADKLQAAWDAEFAVIFDELINGSRRPQ